MSEETKKKVAGIIHTSEGDSKNRRADSKRGIIGRIGAYFSSHWIGSAVIFPIVLIVCIGLLFSIRKEGVIKNDFQKR